MFYKSTFYKSSHREQRSPIWPYFQLNSPYNCSANRSVVDSQVAQARYMSSSLYVDLTRAICIFIRICMGKITIVSVTYENITI